MNRTRIDLHNHTILSDGKLELYELCNLKKDILDTICITDHFPTFPEAYFIAKEFEKSYNQEKNEIFPNLIIGIEYCLGNFVEVLIFGDECINEVIKYSPFNYVELSKILKNNYSSVIICHPVRDDELKNDLLLSITDGIEITLRGAYLKDIGQDFKILKNNYNLNLLSNSDFHSVDTSVRDTYNIIEDSLIVNENDLISSLKKTNLDITNVFGIELDVFAKFGYNEKLFN